ncbi:MAG: glucosaminidase domain-containing protein [Porticoccaceae bacterium]|nr:glucosaminidase domain-containing protein [Porticoccaceae bacterium]
MAVIDRDPLPNFSQYDQVQEKKSAFFDYVLPLVNQENKTVIEDRKYLEMLAEEVDDLSFFQRRTLMELAEDYYVDREERSDLQVIEQLRLRVDPVPPSLALAQAAIESAWGTSRFAVQGNNLFGQWCYKKGCGLVPLRRNSGTQHEVAKFATVSESVGSYIRNINTHRAYQDLRVSRARLRTEQSSASGHQLAENLLEYSELREKYVHEVQAVIRINNLARYDKL